MSSWKKASKTGQKTHRERHQPELRKHLGLLEKKKDYIARANNYHEKQDKLKLLRKRVLNKNPDEFFFHMINSRIENGIHREKDKLDVHTPEQLLLMETQDLKYVAYKRNMEAKKIEKLQGQLHFLDVSNNTKNKHTFFVDKEEKLKHFDFAKKFDTHPALLSRKINRPRISNLETMKLPEIDEDTLLKIEQQKHMAYKELDKRIERERQLSIVQQKLEMQRALKDKKVMQPKQVRPGTKEAPPIYKWKFERKR
ncbi:probable U3 small nucleolar RNA-associated protein 11 [Leptopilina boulardi]|uniref:probable U3 small nucleolar RNA-associated protein 11 n=1 Tax=Leptopilina boulardi TaxID=63433 RepID=UPI0021F500F7|nr:probable U3 small nucleolar RNA-associated protein 11 [Leptopilina boulardi]